MTTASNVSIVVMYNTNWRLADVCIAVLESNQLKFYLYLMHKIY